MIRILVFTAFSMMILVAQAETTPPPSVKDTWDLSSLYKSESAWQTEMKAIAKAVPEFKQCQGKLGLSVDVLKKCLDHYFHELIRLHRVQAWANLQKSADEKTAKNSERAQLAEDLGSKFSQGTAFFSPELSRLTPDYVETFLKLQGAGVYRHYLQVILDHEKHILDPAREELLAAFSPVMWTGSNIQELLLSADVEWPTVTLSDGQTQKINVAGYSKVRESMNREDRRKAFDAFYSTLGKYQRTLGANLATNVKSNVINAKVRNYKNALDAALDGDKIPDKVYRTLVEQVNEGLAVFHRFLKHEAKMLGIKDFSFEDTYVSSADLDVKFPIEKAEATVLGALAPLGDAYVSKLRNAFSQRWMDIYPREGKAHGAFMDGEAYEVHPFLFLNHQDDFYSMSTLAHEWGHAMNTIYSDAAQAYVNSEPPTFTAEIASTFNEVLLHEKMIRDAKTDKEKAFYVESLLKLIRVTFFRQTQLAEFELAIHEEVEKGNALSGEKISEMYGKIVRKYYGHDKGVMRVSQKYFTEWEFIPHFYNSFYVYQYATCISAAFYFAEQVLAKKPGALENYTKVLQAGSSKYPYEILKDAGVDMAKPEVYRAVVRRMEKGLKELAQLEEKH